MDASEMHAITHAELLSLKVMAEGVVLDCAADLLSAAAGKRWDDAMDAADGALINIARVFAFATALEVISGMDALLDDKTTQGVNR